MGGRGWSVEPADSKTVEDLSFRCLELRVSDHAGLAQFGELAELCHAVRSRLDRLRTMLGGNGGLDSVAELFELGLLLTREDHRVLVVDGTSSLAAKRRTPLNPAGHCELDEAVDHAASRLELHGRDVADVDALVALADGQPAQSFADESDELAVEADRAAAVAFDYQWFRGIGYRCVLFVLRHGYVIHRALSTVVTSRVLTGTRLGCFRPIASRRA